MKKISRYTALTIIMLLVFSSIAARLFYLQVLESATFKDDSNHNLIKHVSEEAPRGNITDRNGVVLATNKESFSLIFAETTESYAKFFDTMDKVFKVMDDTKEVQQDKFPIKINPFSYDFSTVDAKGEQTNKLRFEKDRGFDTDIITKLYGKGKDLSTLTDNQNQEIDSELLRITPEQAFNKLWDQYTKDYLTNKKVDAATKAKIRAYTTNQKRRLIVIKDALKVQSFSGYKSIVIINNISKNTAFVIAQELNDLPGIDITTQPYRYYPQNTLASSAIGYLSKISADDKAKYTERNYDPAVDFIGITGIEKAFENRLKGSAGEKIIEVNTQGREIKEQASKDPYPGQNVQLTIDKNVQYAAEQSLNYWMNQLQTNPANNDVYTANANRGAAVAIDVNTGEILALASEPGFDPNDFIAAGGLSSALQKKYLIPDLATKGMNYIESKGLAGGNVNDLFNKMFPLDTSVKGNTTARNDYYDVFPKPLLNYATSQMVPPGSTFKPLTAVAGLETKVISPQTSVYDAAQFDPQDGGPVILFPSDAANGYISLTQAIGKSSNPYFMTVGKLLRNSFGEDILAKYAWKFGLGVDPTLNTKASTGIEIDEAFGQTSNSVSLKNTFANGYYYQPMDALKTGVSWSNVKFPSINLYFEDGDTDSVYNLKKEIKDHIKQTIRTGNRDESTYKAQLLKLTQIDNAYKGKTFTKTDFIVMGEVIAHSAVDDLYRQATTPRNIYNASIGQGISQFTPLQLASYVATLVNGGTRYSAHLVNKITDANGKVIENVKPKVLNKTDVSQSTIDAVKQGMKAVTDDKGTAAGYFDGFPISTAGKTGSATFSDKQADYGRTAYAVYVGFAPFDNPKIAVCIVVYDGGHGSFIAPVARAMYEAYFKDQLIKSNYTPPSSEAYMQDMFKKK